ncbi:hypothetical protein VPH35_104609 [Triticum aestivum]
MPQSLSFSHPTKSFLRPRSSQSRRRRCLLRPQTTAIRRPMDKYFFELFHPRPPLPLRTSHRFAPPPPPPSSPHSRSPLPIDLVPGFRRRRTGERRHSGREGSTCAWWAEGRMGNLRADLDEQIEQLLQCKPLVEPEI